jgi:hypothetical protein
MLHVRVVSPAALTGRLADVLAAAPGVQNLMVQAGAASRPDGDAVQFDMHDEAANPVFRDLRGLGLDRGGLELCASRAGRDQPNPADRGPRRSAGPIPGRPAMIIPTWFPVGPQSVRKTVGTAGFEPATP